MSKKDSVGVALQTNITTPKTTMDYWPPVTAESLELNRDEMSISETYGVRAPSDADAIAKSVSGRLEGAVRPTSIGAFLTACFGEPVTTETVVGTVYTHVWDAMVATGPLPLSIMSINADVSPSIVELYEGCMLNNLELSCASKDYMLMAADFLGLDIDTTQSAPTVTRDGSKKFRWDQVTAKLGANGETAAAFKITDFNFSYGNGVELDEPAMGSQASAGATAGNVGLGASFTVAENLGTHRSRALLDTPDNCQLVLEATGAALDGTHNISLKIDIARLQYTAAPVGINGGEILKNVKVDCRGSLNEATNKLVTITLVNGESGAKYKKPVA